MSYSRMWIQRSDPILTMGVDFMRPGFNLEPKCWVTMLTRIESTRGTGTPSVAKGLVWFTEGCRMKERTGTGI